MLVSETWPSVSLSADAIMVSMTLNTARIAQRAVLMVAQDDVKGELQTNALWVMVYPFCVHS